MYVVILHEEFFGIGHTRRKESPIIKILNWHIAFCTLSWIEKAMGGGAVSSLPLPTEKHCHLAVERAASAPCLLCGRNSDIGSAVCLPKVKWQILSQ